MSARNAAAWAKGTKKGITFGPRSARVIEPEPAEKGVPPAVLTMHPRIVGTSCALCVDYFELAEGHSEFRSGHQGPRDLFKKGRCPDVVVIQQGDDRSGSQRQA